MFGDTDCVNNPFAQFLDVFRLTFTAADGTEYELRSKLTQGEPQNLQCGHIGPPLGTDFVTADGTSALFVCDADPSRGFALTGYLTLRDGTRYTILNGGVTDIRDRNGNNTHFDYEISGFGRLIQVTDSLGRVVTIQYDQSDSMHPEYGVHDKITYIGFGVAPVDRVVRVSRAFLSTVLRPPYQPRSTYSLFPELSGSSQQGAFDTYVVSAVWLPNDKKYSLLYNSYGELARVVLPTGGAIEYDWDGGIGLPSDQNPSSSGVWSPNIYRRVVERRTYPDGGNGPQFEGRTVYGHQEYVDNGELHDRGYVAVDEYGAGGVLSRSNHYFHGYASYAPFNPFTGGGPPTGGGSVFYTPWRFGKEYRAEWLNIAGTVLRSTTNTWVQPFLSWWPGSINDAPPNNPRVDETTTTLADVTPNKVNKKKFTYEDVYNNQIAVEEYDYGSTSPPALPIRRTETDYVTTSSYVANAIHLISLPSEQRVHAIDSSGMPIQPPVATTHFSYDQFSLTARSGIVGLDPNFTSLIRGNLTTVTRSVDGGGINTTSHYDVAGNVVSVTDPLNHTASIDYADSFSDLVNHHTFAFPTSGTSPIPDSGSDPNLRHGSNTAFTSSATYDYHSGFPASFTDANGKTTTYQFTDSLDRLTGITRPTGGGVTSYDYGDDAGNLFVHTLSDLDVVSETTRRTEGYQYFDGLGRTTRSFIYDGTVSTPWIVSDIHYDGSSRVLSVSNPYRVSSVSSTVPACGTCTTTGYDIVGRVHTVTLPDGAVTTTDYSNNTVTTTDPAGKKRSATGDGLGRMLTVVENPGVSPTYTTTYVYDLLNNLRKVTQGSQTRFFYYDALSRLRREKNPEQEPNTLLSQLTDPVTQNSAWSVEYTYDDNGNLTKKADPRNISVNIGYDTLNRPITRTYIGDSATPPVDYIYDGARVSGGITNSKGRLTAVLTSSPFSSSYAYDSFDEMGRVLHTTETVESNPAYTMSYQYNLAGGLTSETYPSNKTYATAYDIAGRIAGVTGPGNKVYADSFTYAPHGGLAQMRLGNQLWEHANFNMRLQPTEIGIGTGQSGSASVDRLKLSYDYGTTDNNGNVKSQTITVPVVDGVTGTTLNQCYTYDEFNRLKVAEEKTGATPCAGTTVWTQKYMYDQQGNRRFDAGTTIPVGFPNPTINTANNNRIDMSQGYVYDLAGNVTQDPSHSYTFDAEERQTKVDAGVNGQYFYDGRGQRVKSITSAGTTIYVYDAMGRLVAEYTTGNATGSGTSYITADALGSPRLITAQDKSVKARHDYLPFGEGIPAGYGSRSAAQGYVADGLRQKFTGKERDVESGLDYFGSRYYGSGLGRFNSADSMFGSAGNPQTLNRYAYTLNNPLRYTDPTGHDPSASDDCDYYDDNLQRQAHQTPPVTTLEFNAEAAAQVESGIGSYAAWGLGPVIMSMIDIWASPALVAESAPTGGTIAYQMLAGVTDAADPVGGLVQRFTDALTGVSSVDRTSLGYEAGNQLIGPMLITGLSLGAGGVAEEGASAGATTLYRIISNSEPVENFVSNAARGLAPRGPEIGNTLIHEGISMFDSIGAAASRVPILERAGKTVYGIAEMSIREGAGVSVTRTLGAGHYTVSGEASKIVSSWTVSMLRPW